MEEKLNNLEQHIAKLEKAVYKKEMIIPSPPIREEDHIDPELIKMIHDRKLENVTSVRRVPSDYYERELEYRRDCIGAQSTEQLCKCVLFEVKDAPNEINKYACVVIQYIDKIDSLKLTKVISQILGSKVTEVSLAKEEEAYQLSHSEHNAMTPVFMRPSKEFAKYKVPIILTERIAALDPKFFWLGGGEVDVKFGITLTKFITEFKPYVFDISK